MHGASRRGWLPCLSSRPCPSSPVHPAAWTLSTTRLCRHAAPLFGTPASHMPAIPRQRQPHPRSPLANGCGEQPWRELRLGPQLGMQMPRTVGAPIPMLLSTRQGWAQVVALGLAPTRTMAMATGASPVPEGAASDAVSDVTTGAHTRRTA